ncbi:serine/threonine-protein kinase [Shewanella woodyi]|uniref:Serine/threonine protein kinase n=1 Tax=Shewanella woodyi (strain ATCC 51908 / MS32) TaxID=392500 RepID=B1KPI9_SHEWM|nr:serine/threonine-protein kinase [Shewanella woodyi]ACA86142.1 serine/threonine protein kinase [Shewanella woodyi ATCC 51908]
MKPITEPTPLQLPEFISDKYTLTDTLGAGGMGKVYLAQDTRLHRTVAIKVLNKASDGSQTPNKTLDEARALAKLNHPNIVQIYDVLEHQSQLVLVMEFIEGQPLQQFQHEQLPSLIQKLTILHQICLGLAAAHHVGVVHCDLKASNIIITSETNEGGFGAKIVDFGIAQTQRSVQALQNVSENDESLVASQGCKIAMSPEQLNGLPINHLSDLFSFGILAYRFISGHHPFGTGSASQIGDNIITTPAPDAFELVPQIPAALAKLLNQLLQKQPADRVQSAKQVADKLQQIIIAQTQEEILQQQTVANTPLYDRGTETEEHHAPSKDNTLRDNALRDSVLKTSPLNTLSKKSILITAAALCLLTALLLANYPSLLAFMNPAPSSTAIKHQVVVIPPTLESSSFNNQNPIGSNLLASAEPSLLVATMDDAIKQYIIQNQSMQLISSSEVNAIEGDINAIGNYTGATDILTSEINCNITRCNITLSRLNKSSDSQRWTVSEQDHWPVILENFYATHNDTQLKLAKLFSDSVAGEQVNMQVSEQDYLSYIELYSIMKLRGEATENHLITLEKILVNSPHLFSGYGLYRESALNLYADTNDEKYMEGIVNLINQSPPEYRYSVEQAIDQFAIAITTNEFEQAEKQLTIAKQRGADETVLIELQAYLFLASNQLKQAINTYQKALSLRPSTKLLYNLALSYWWQSDSIHTKKTLKTLLSINPKHYFANQLLADISLIEGDLEQAIALYVPLVKTNNQSIDISNLGLSYALSGKYQQALKMAQLAVDSSPNHPNWVLNLADIQLILGKTSQSTTNYRQVLALTQGQSDRVSLLLSAQAYAHLKEYNSAIKVINMAKKLNPDDGEVSLVAAIVYTRIGEHISALSQVEEALNSNIGAAWFNLPWFDSLCDTPKFNQLLVDAGNNQRCQLG